MNAHSQQPARVIQSTVVVLVSILLQSCGHGDNSDSVPLQSLSSSLTIQGAAVQPEAKVLGGTPVVLVDTGGSTRTLSIRYGDGSSVQLINDPNDKTRFWMPIVTEALSVSLTATADGREIASMPISLMPYASDPTPGEVTLNFLYGSKIRQQAAIDVYTGKPAYATALKLLTDALVVTDQQIAWVTAAIKDGAATVADPIRPATGTLDRAGLKVMDQYVMQWVSQVYPGQVRIASVMTMQDIFLTLMPSARATDTIAACHLDRPVGAPMSTSLQADQAWCVSQIHIDDAEEIANYANAITVGVKYAGLALAAVPIALTAGSTAAITTAAIAAGLITTAQITGYSADLLSILASAGNGRLGEAGVKAIVAAVQAGTAQFIDELPLPLPKALSDQYAEALTSLAKAPLDDSYKEAIDKAAEDLVEAAKGSANEPAAPSSPEQPNVPIGPSPTPGTPSTPTAPTAPSVPFGAFSVSKPLACSPNTDGTARVTGQLLADLAPGEQITIVSGTARYYTGSTSSCGGSDTYNVPQDALPPGLSFPSFENASANCTPPDGLELHPVSFAVCHNPETAAQNRGVAVDIDTSVSKSLISFSPNIIVVMCRATTRNLNASDTVMKARAGVQIYQALTCGAPAPQAAP